MTSLADLFPGGRRADIDAAVVHDDFHTMRRLSEIIGDPREDLDATRPRSNAQELVKRVNAAAQDAAPPNPAPLTPAGARKRRRRRIDVLNVSVASVAVIAVASALVVGGVQAATASPAAGALQSLRSDEAAIQNSYQSVVAGSERLSAAIEQGKSDAAALRAALETTGTAPEPEGSTDGGSMPIADEAALTAVIAAVDAYLTSLDDVAQPELPTAYERGGLNEESLAEVGAAIDDAQRQLSEISAAASELRDVRTQVEDLRAPLQQALATYAATFPARAESVLRDNPGAEPALRNAVTAAAAGIVGTGASGAEGIAALNAYRDAVVAVREDQLGVERERREAEEQRRQNQPQPQPQPTEPVPTEPQPTEPPATDPGVPPVEEPPDGGGVL